MLAGAHAAGVHAAHGAQGFLAQFGVQHAKPILPVQGALTVPAGTDLGIVLRGRVLAQVERAVKPAPQLRAAGCAQEVEVVLQGDRDRPALAAGGAACTLLAAETGVVIGDKVLVFLHHDRLHNFIEWVRILRGKNFCGDNERSCVYRRYFCCFFWKNMVREAELLRYSSFVVFACMPGHI